MTEATTPILKMITNASGTQWANDWAQEGFDVDQGDPLHLCVDADEFVIRNDSPNKAMYGYGGSNKGIFGLSGDRQTVTLGSGDTSINLYDSEAPREGKPFVTLKLTKSPKPG